MVAGDGVVDVGESAFVDVLDGLERGPTASTVADDGQAVASVEDGFQSHDDALDVAVYAESRDALEFTGPAPAETSGREASVILHLVVAVFTGFSETQNVAEVMTLSGSR